MIEQCADAGEEILERHLVNSGYRAPSTRELESPFPAAPSNPEASDGANGWQRAAVRLVQQFLALLTRHDLLVSSRLMMKHGANIRSRDGIDIYHAPHRSQAS